MSTLKQKRLAKAIVENSLAEKPKNAGELLELAGYDKTTAEATPGRIIAQQGVQEALKEEQKTMLDALEDKGITPEYVAERIGVLLADVSPKAISAGVTHVMKIGVGGGYKTEEPPNPTTVNYNIFNRPEMKITVAQFEERIKEQLMQGNVQTTQEPLEA